MTDDAIRLSCSDQSFIAIPHAAAIGLIAQLGFPGFDLMLHGNRSHLRPEALRGDVPACAGRIEERVRAHGLEFSDVFLIPWTDFETMAVNHPDQAERERGEALFRDGLELTARIGAPGITMLPGIDWPGETHEQSLARTVAGLTARVAAARERGIRFSIEPHVGSICASPAETEQLCELVAGLELTLDYSHYVAQGFSVAEAEPLIARARHFHARGAANGRMQTSMTGNEIDYERTVGALRAGGFEGSISIEYVWDDGGELDGVDVASETVIMRDRLQAGLAGRAWTYPELG
jgi:sugar phosphate isomerase/epimerase